MTFASFAFIAFFAALLALRSLTRSDRGEQWLLLGASICFYLTWSVPCVALILFTSFLDYRLGRKMAASQDPVERKRLLQLSLAANLGLLGFFKYTNFFLDNIAALAAVLGMHMPHLHLDIILPPAISYYTFGTLTYMIDLYYERIPPCESPRQYFLFVSFFPKLLSGPIARARDFLPQLAQRRSINAVDFESGLLRFLQGAVKKLVIADQLAGNVSLIFAAPNQYDAVTLVEGALGYAAQLYCDFSGYSDMAIGAARMLGFHLQENFQMPFSAGNITEFWRRWHISLSTWLRDYLFMPLEMATRSNPWRLVRVSLNVFITFLLAGLWHEASWNFIIFGAIMGAALAVHVIWMSWKPLARWRGRRVVEVPWAIVAHGLTLGVVLVSLIFMRSPSVHDALVYLGRLAVLTHDGVRVASPYIPPAVAAVILAHVVLGKDSNWAETIPSKPVLARVLAYSCLLGLLVFLGATDAAPFIYFKF